MLDANDILNAIKRAAIEAVNASKPSDFCFGKVISTNPLKISVDQKIMLGSAQLVLTRNVTDFKTKVTFSGGMEEMTIHNALQVGDGVVLLKKQGGQTYLVMDKVVKA